MKKVAKAAIVAVIMMVALNGGAALAATPSNKGCLGADTSGYAKAGRAFGQLVGGIAASGPRAIGAEVQAHLAGEIPDSVFPNSCND